MSSNKELCQSIQAICSNHNLPVPEGLLNMNNRTLSAELNRLKAEVEAKVPAENNALENEQATHDFEGGTQPEKKEVVADSRIAEREIPNTEFLVSQGKSITSLKGILGEGEEIKPDWLAGGQTSFDDLLSKGYIIRGA